MRDIVVIGGGASGMAAAVKAADACPAARILILEKNGMPGKKLRATGNGRCNLTNAACIGVQDVLRFFDEIGIVTRTEEEGRVYPYCGRAEAVAEALETALAERGVVLHTEASVSAVRRETEGFRIFFGQRTVDARMVLIAAGGKAGPQFGTCGDGYGLAKSLGHAVTRTYPVLTSLQCGGHDFSKLKGRIRGRAVLLRRGDPVAEECGEIQFTEYGLSGICIFNLSRFLSLQRAALTDYEICLDFIPETGLEALVQLAAGREAQIISSIVGKALAADIDGDLRKIKEWRTVVTGVSGWRFAQVTAGGVPFSEVYEGSMESRLVNGLFFAGEILDYDGPCGGYNLQNAWKTGIAAGQAMGMRCFG